MYELVRWIWEHRNQPITWATALSFMWLILDKLGRKLINSQLKRLFRIRQKSEFSEYVANQNRIESKIDLLLEERGLKWDVDSRIGKSVPSGTTGRTMKSSSPLAASVLATITKLFTPLKAIFHSSQRRMKMKSKLLSRKFLMALVSGILVVLNDGLNLGLDQNTIIAFCSIVVGYIVGEAATDVAKAKNTGFDETKTH